MKTFWYFSIFFLPTQRKSHTSWRFLIDGDDSGRSTLLGSTKSMSGRATLLGPSKSEKKSSIRNSLTVSPPVKVGSYKGTIVSIKILTKKNLDINRSLKKQLYIRKELNHDNINRFIGVCVESPHLYIVTQYCARGSLKVGLITYTQFVIKKNIFRSAPYDQEEFATYVSGSGLINGGVI